MANLDQICRSVFGKKFKKPTEHTTETRYHEIRRNMFEPSDDKKFPRLKGRAAELRHLARPILEVWENTWMPLTEGTGL